jgi:NADPH-dependent 2,4-dienoyl-CoA reductase/sulfur reductase-like enzyme/rhodanese-related sulfurtransferase
MKLVIVGGVAGGASAAARARRLDERSEIVLFERGGEPSFANCGMPYYIGGEITDRGKLLVTPVERLRQRYRLDVRVRTVVEAIDRLAKTVRVRDLDSGRVYDESYDKLILSPGAAPLRPPLPGIDLPGIHTLRDLHDCDRIKAAVDDGVREALIVGAGFIGLEMAENLARRGVRTTVIELADQIVPPWDREMTVDVAAHLREHGVRLVLGDAVAAFTARPGGGLRAATKSGLALECDLALLSVGVRPENSLATAAGLEVGPRGGIRVDPSMRTSDPDIYAVGDAVETRDFVLRSPTQVPLAGPANRQGRIAADHANGRPNEYRGTQGTSILGVFAMTLALTGASEKSLVRAGTPFRKVYLHPGHHASYYPGAEGMTIKLLFAPDTGRILGAQATGRSGVDKRIDVLAIAIQAGMTVFDLEQAELAYAPQYGSAKDPINMAGFIAAGVLRGDHPQITPDQLASQPPETLILDVRTPAEHAQGKIPGAVNIPVDELRNRLGEIPLDRPLVVHCQVGMRGYLATRVLLQSGRVATNLSGGFQSYRQFFPS